MPAIIHKLEMGKKSRYIIIAGDYHAYGSFGKFLKENPTHQVFSDEIKNIIRQSRYSVFNLEDPVSDTKYRINKYGPHGVAPIQSLAPIKDAGFNLATFATNHTLDAGEKGILDTVKHCKSINLKVVGAGLNHEEARKIIFENIDEIKVAFLNFTREEFNIAKKNQGGANPLNIIDNTKDIVFAKQNADKVIVIVHEGLDVYPVPYPDLVKQMRFYAEMGADAVILHHSRLISGYEEHNGTPIFYGIGNLLHLSKNKNEHTGIMLKLIIGDSKNISFEIIPLKFDPSEKIVTLAEPLLETKIFNQIQEASKIIRSKKLLDEEWVKYVKKKETLYLSILSGYPILFYRIVKKLKLERFYKKLLTLNKKKLKARLNLVRCQAHREALVSVLEKNIAE